MKNNNKFYFYILSIIIFYFFIQMSAFSQHTDWINYTTGTHVTAIADDGDYLWIGCEGLIKFNKKTGNYLYFNKTNSALLENTINSIVLDKSKNIWIGTPNGLNLISRGIWQQVFDKRYFGVSELDVRAMTIDKQDKLWFVTATSTLFSISTRSSIWSSHYIHTFRPIRVVYSLAIDSLGNKWIGTESGILILQGSDWKIYDPSTEMPFRAPAYSIVVDSQNSKWIAGSSGLVRVDSTNWQLVASLNHLILLTFDKQGVLWAGTEDQGIAKLKNGVWERYTHEKSNLPSNCIRALMFDQENVLWVGTFPERELTNFRHIKGGGLTRYDGNHWETFRFTNSGLENAYINVIAIDSSGNLWFGTADGLTYYDRKNWRHYRTSNSPLPDNGIITLLVDSSNRLWIGTQQGLILVDHDTWKIYQSGNSPLPDNEILALAQDRHKKIWIGSINALSVFDGNQWMVYDQKNTSLNLTYISAIDFDSKANTWFLNSQELVKFDGRLWEQYFSCPMANTLALDKFDQIWIGRIPDYIGDTATNGGVYWFDGHNWNILKPYFYNCLWANTLKFDKNGNLWIGFNPYTNFLPYYNGTYRLGGGLIKYDGNTCRQYDINNSGLPHNYVKSLAVDRLGNLWVGTYGQGVALYREGGPILSVEIEPASHLRNKFEPLSVFPNPFNSMTQIFYQLDQPADITLKIFNLLGQEILTLAEQNHAPGSYVKQWNGKDINGLSVPAGIYIIRIAVVNQRERQPQLAHRKLVLLY